MGRVAGALILHELAERSRDRWVLVTTALFTLLACGIALYGRSTGSGADAVTGPSLVTLCALLVPLVALVLGYDGIVGERERHTLGMLLVMPVSRLEILLAKYTGRGLALGLSIGLGLGLSAFLLNAGQRAVLLHIIGPTLLLGGSFLAWGLMISSVVDRHATAASLAVVSWFGLVFFWDLGILAVMVASDGALSQETVSWLVHANPVGLYRTGLMVDLVGSTALEELGLTVALPGRGLQALLWGAWIAAPLALGGLALSLRRSER